MSGSFMEKMRNGGEVTIAFLGDSITQGCFEGDASREDAPYVYHSRLVGMWKEAYPNTVVHKINAGIGGNTAGMGLYRLKKDVISLRPDFCVVCFGLNDTPFAALRPFLKGLPFVREMMRQMGPQMDPVALQLLRECRGKDAYRYAMNAILDNLARENIPAMVMTPNGMSHTGLRDRKDPFYLLSKVNAQMVRNGTMDEMMDIARETAKEHHIPVADCYARWKELEKKGIVTDDTYVNGTNHPSRELHQELAEVLYQAFEKME